MEHIGQSGPGSGLGFQVQILQTFYAVGSWLGSGPWHLHRNVPRFRGGLVFKADSLCVSLNSRLGSNKEEEEKDRGVVGRAPDALVEGHGDEVQDQLAEPIWHI